MRVWNWPVLPVMPCVMTFVLLSTRMLMIYRTSCDFVPDRGAGVNQVVQILQRDLFA
jgi:hypothetical protein